MNGEFLNLYNKLLIEFEVTREVNKERWKNHSDRDKELKDNVSAIFEKLDSLPCGANTEKIDNNTTTITTIIDNHLKHIDQKINGLLFTVLGACLIGVIVGAVRLIYTFVK